jgi:DNA-binding NtrC family response regulator
MKALLIEDEESVRSALVDMLDRVGLADVYEAENVEQARAAYRCQGPFDLYLVDLILPGAHGTCFIDKLPKSERRRVLIMSGHVDDNVHWICGHLGLEKSQVMSKPPELEFLRDKVTKLLEGGVNVT